MFFKIGALKNFPRFIGKHLCWSLFLIKLLAFRLIVDLICLNGQILDNEPLSIRLNLFNVGSEIRKPSLIIDTIFIRVNLGTFREHFLVVFKGDDSRLYKTIKSRNY